MLKAIKIRIYPSDEQKQFINKQLGCCRVVYNSCLAYRRDKYEKEGISITSSQAINYIVELKKRQRVVEGSSFKGTSTKCYGYEFCIQEFL